MAKSTITILVNGKWSGDGIAKAASDLARLGKVAGTSSADASKALSRLGSDTDKYQAKIASTCKSSSMTLMQTAEKVVAAGAQIYGTSEKLVGIGRALTTGVTLPLAAIGGYAAKTAVEYDTAMADLRKTSDMTAAELDRMGAAARELSTTQPVTAAQILSIESLGAQLGISKGSLESFARTVSGLDIATNMDAETAATEMARFANIVGMADEDMGRYGSTLVAIGNNMATTESEVSQMAQRFASAGSQAGLTEAEILGMSAAMSSLGIKSEMGGSALSQIFVKISNAAANGGSELDAFAKAAGMSAEEFAAAWREDAAGAFNSLVEGIGTATKAGEDMNVIMGELGFTQIRQSDVMRRLAGSTQAVTDKESVLAHALELSKGAWESNSALQSEVDKRNESMAARLQVLKNKVDDVAITVGVPLVNAAIAALDASAPLIEGLGDMAEAFASMDEEGQRNVLMLAAVAAGAGPVSGALGTVGKGVSNLVTGLGHGMQAVGAFSDAMRTVDGSQIRAYSSLDTYGAKLGIANNAIVKAAGSVDKYVETWEEWYDAGKRSLSLQEQINAEKDKATALEDKLNASRGQGNKKLEEKIASSKKHIESLDGERRAALDVVSANQKQMKAWADASGASDDFANAQAKQTKVTERLGDAAKLAGSQALSFAKGLAKSVAVAGVASLAIAAVGAVINDMATRAREAKEKQELLNESGKTFADITREAAEGAESQAKSLGALSESVSETMVGLSELNGKTAETFAEFEVNSATLDDYVATISELGKKGSLTATEQEKLKLAVSGYNEITGDSIQITDAAKGELSKSTEEIDKNAQAWKRNAEAQAMQELAVEYAKQHAKAKLELSRAEESAAKANERYDKISGEVLAKQRKGVEVSLEESQKLTDAAAARDKANQTLKDAKHNYDSASKSVDELTRAQALNSEACVQMIDTLKGMEGVAGPLQEAGVSLEDLSLKLVDAGYSSEQMAEMGPRIAELATAFNGNLDSMVWALENYNNVPMVDKDGNVIVDDESLIDAQGNVWTWNGTTFESKTTDASVKDRLLRDAQGRVWTWNGTTLESKSAQTMVDSEDVQKDLDRTNKRRKNPPKKQDADTKVDSKSTEKDIGLTAKRAKNPPRNQTATTTINRIETTVRSTRASTYMASGGYRFHADGGIATRATLLTRDIVGEAGAEAIVPLTNRRYAMPFVKMIGEETARNLRGGGGGNTYNLYLNGGAAGSPSPRVERMVEEIFKEYELNMRMV